MNIQDTKSVYSFWDLLAQYRIRIPMIQRDYAQGREDDRVVDIREKFVEALYQSLCGQQPVELDFIYGSLLCSQSAGEADIFIPLDGQQRLTTLFLLHCYIAAQKGIQEHDKERLSKFSYEIRDSARLFCQSLTTNLSDLYDETRLPPSQLITNCAWYLPNWRYDPTIAGMLVMLDTLHDRFKNQKNYERLWAKLVKSSDTASLIFYVLILEDHGIPDSIYIKMNSRGKELTELENFKAHFLSILQQHDLYGYHDAFVEKFHEDWTDVFWNCFGCKEIAANAGNTSKMQSTGDDEFLKYIKFITSILYADLIQENGERDKNSKLDIFKDADIIYSNDKEFFPFFGKNIAFLFSALDVWAKEKTEEKIAKIFASLFTTNRIEAQKVRLFDNEINLFKSACTEPNNISIARRILFFACLSYRINQLNPVPERLRIIRNLVANSDDEMRREVEIKLFKATYAIMYDGLLAANAGDFNKNNFNTNQWRHEVEKQELLETTTNPILRETIYRLENHELLRGCLTLFNLKDPKFIQRASTFEALFKENRPPEYFSLIHRALLTYGDYSIHEKNGRRRFGSTSLLTWRRLLTQARNAAIEAPLMALLDDISKQNINNIPEFLNGLIRNFCKGAENEKHFDWRYYFIKYPAMLHENCKMGIYDWKDDFTLRMLSKARLSGFHTDPYFYTAWLEVTGEDPEARQEIEKNKNIQNFIFWGHLNDTNRWIILNGVKIRCAENGWQFSDSENSPALTNGGLLDENGFLPLGQGQDGSCSFDKQDRIAQIIPVLERLLH